MIDSVVGTAREDGRQELTEPEAKSVLEAAGFDIPDGEVVATPDAAVAAAEAIGYPVVIKVVSTTIHHKTEWGDGAGVATDVGDATSVRKSTRRIRERLTDVDSDGRILVETAADVTAGTELLLGGTRDPAFGPTVTLGLGGIYAEVFEDVAHRLAPVGQAQARGMLREFAGAQLLDGVRGAPAADTAAVVDAVVRIGNLLADEPAIAEVDVNPLLATAEDTTALDALIRLDGSD